MSGAHAKLAPSSAIRWVRCAGSVPLEALFPEMEDSADSAEGTAAHWAGFELFHGRVIDVGLVAPNGVALTDEMIEGAEMYVDELRAIQALGLEMVLERPVAIPYVHELNWGTPDCRAFDRDGGVLYVLDYKFGHKFVDVFENWQLIDYACGVLDELGIDGRADQSIEVRFSIVQPRSYHRDGPIRTWNVKASALRPYFNILQSAAAAALAPSPLCTPNPECTYCLGRHACQALQKDAYRSAQLSSASVPVVLSADAIGLELHFLHRAQAMLKARVSGLEQQALSHFSRGEQVPHFAMLPKVGREEWAKPIEEVLELGKLFGLSLAKPDVITPNQATKLGLPAEVVQSYIERKRGLALAPDDGSKARKVFGN